MAAFPQSLALQPLSLTSQPLDPALQPLDPTLSPAGGAASTVTALALAMQQQLQSNWCWAAVGTSVGLFYTTGSWSQCAVATTSIPNFPGSPAASFDCCNLAAPCNIYGYLDVSLSTALSFASMQSGALAFTDLQAQIGSSQRPVCLRIAWNGSGAHFVAISGFIVDALGTQYVRVADPGSGAITTQAFSTFPANYSSGGTWTH